MRWRLKDYVDFPMDDALLDILAMPADTQVRQTQQAMAMVVQRGDYNRWAIGADDVGLRWRALEVPETAARVLSAFAEQAGEAHGLLVFGQAYALLIITYKGMLVMTRNIEVTLDSIVGDSDARGSALGRASLEVLRTLDNFDRMHSEVRLSGLSVVSPQEGDEIIEVLTDLIYVPVSKYRLADWVDLSALGDTAQRLGQSGNLEEYAAIGAAMRGYAQHLGVQLLQLVDEREKRLQKTPWSASLGLRLTAGVAGGALSAGALMTTGAVLMDRKIRLLEQEAQSAKARTSLPQAPVEVKQLTELQNKENKQRQLRDVMKSAVQQTQTPYSDYLTALARQTMPGLWITDLSVGDRGMDVTLVGRMTDPGRLPSYLARMEQEPQFQGRRFAQVELRAVTNEPGVMSQIIEFTLRGRPARQVESSRPRVPREVKDIDNEGDAS
jgi:Tfp pilus assembly protein PilN